MEPNEMLEKLRLLVYPTNGDPENEYKWVIDFNVECTEFGPTKLANHLVMMGCNTAADCTADYSHDPHEIDKDPERHDELHRLYNTLVWRALKNSGMMSAVRTVIKRDLLVPNTIPDSGDDFGRIVRKDYGRKLLDHFLKSRPSPDWVLPQ